MKKVNVYEDNGGGIHAIVLNNENPTNIISGFEDGTMSTAEFVNEARYGFTDADEYDAASYSELSLEDAATEIMEQDDLIAEITTDRLELDFKKMGIAGTILFSINLQM